jgi:predicted transcriptional regulator
MEVHLTPEQEAELSELASRKGWDPDKLAQEVLDFYMKHEARFVDAVKRGVASADRGDLIEHDLVLARIERLVNS